MNLDSWKICSSNFCVIEGVRKCAKPWGIKICGGQAFCFHKLTTTQHGWLIGGETNWLACFESTAVWLVNQVELLLVGDRKDECQRITFFHCKNFLQFHSKNIHQSVPLNRIVMLNLISYNFALTV